MDGEFMYIYTCSLRTELATAAAPHLSVIKVIININQKLGADRIEKMLLTLLPSTANSWAIHHHTDLSSRAAWSKILMYISNMATAYISLSPLTKTSINKDAWQTSQKNFHWINYSDRSSILCVHFSTPYSLVKGSMIYCQIAQRLMDTIHRLGKTVNKLTSGWSFTGTNSFSVSVTLGPSSSGSARGFFCRLNNVFRTLFISVECNKSNEPDIYNVLNSTTLYI